MITICCDIPENQFLVVWQGQGADMRIVPLKEENGNPVVQYYETTNFRLKSGKLAPKARLGFCVFGQAGAPIIVLHTAVSGSPRAWVVEKTQYGDGWWNRHFGPGRMLDTDQYRIICVSHFGGNGPSSTADELNDVRFDLTILDTCHLVAQLLAESGETSVHAVIGVSMGAAIAREWLFQKNIEIKRVVEIFGNFGNNFSGAIAKKYCHIQIDLLHSNGSNLDEIRDRIVENCGVMRNESPAFAVAFDHIISEYNTLYDDHSNENILRVTRMIGFLRFVTPQYFQEKWDKWFNENMNASYADQQLREMCSYLGSTFVKTFRRSSLGSLRFMDAQPRPIDPSTVAGVLRQRNANILGLIVRGDRLYDPRLQLEQYVGIRQVLDGENDRRVRIHLCTNLLRGHDHFLSEDFDSEAGVIRSFIEEEALT
jgi:homoserine acetyltransferase